MRGFSIIELLIAMCLTVIVCGAALSFIGPANDAFQVQPEVADLQQRMRVGTEAVQQELRMAGAGMYAAGVVGPLLHSFAPLMPYRAFDASESVKGVFFRADTISLIFVPSTASQTTLAAPLTAGSAELDLEQPTNCPRASITRVCGFAIGDLALVFDPFGSWEVLEIDAVNGVTGTLRIRGSSTRGFPSGSNVAKVRAATYALKPDPQTAAYQLVRINAFGIAQPVIDHVVKMGFQYFADPQPPRVVEETGESAPRATYGPPPPRRLERRGAWPPGENCTFVVVDGKHQPRLPVLGDSLIEVTPASLTDGPWCPDDASTNRFDADLLRIRRVRFTLRVQTALTSLRGPAGVLFMKGGTAKSGSRMVPDMEMQIDVSPRNMNLER